MQIKNHYLKKAYAWLLPFTCVLCSHPSFANQDLCDPCLQALPRLEEGCIRCAIPLSIKGSLCGQCLQKNPPFDVTHALYSYELPITKLILELKFNHTLFNARLLGELLAIEIRQNWYKNKPLPDLIIPIPLHAARLKERGFNQALELARPIAHYLKRPLEIKHCHRTKLTSPQSTLLAAERQKNVRDAFDVSRNFTGLHVAVIDDVITTGNTMTEFCKVLKQQGVKQIDAWCCAKVK